MDRGPRGRVGREKRGVRGSGVRVGLRKTPGSRWRIIREQEAGLGLRKIGYITISDRS